MTEITLFPQPQRLERREGQFTLDAGTRIVAQDSGLGDMLAAYLRPATGYALPVVRAAGMASVDENTIVLSPDDADSDSAEAYTLAVTPARVTLSASQIAGFIYGMQTLRQLLPPQIMADAVVAGIDWTIPALSISDTPAFGWRGLHLDVGRHMFPVAFIKKFIDMMAFYKYNTLHFHLTEDQGWRVEIKKYPRLTEVGGFREETVVPGTWDEYDGVPYGGFYTQAELRELVSYAAARGITIVPEIELPGHAVAALTAYPRFGLRRRRLLRSYDLGYRRGYLLRRKGRGLRLSEGCADGSTCDFPLEIHSYRWR